MEAVMKKLVTGATGFMGSSRSGMQLKRRSPGSPRTGTLKRNNMCDMAGRFYDLNSKEKN
jgi:hypothetical protein